MRWLRWVAAAAAALAVLVIAAAVYLATLDLGDYKGRIEAALREVVGRPVEVKGPLSLAWAPKPLVTAADIRIANLDWGSAPELAVIETATMGIELWPLLRGDVEVDMLALSRARILLERGGPEEAGNWKALGPKRDGRDSGPRGEPSLRQLRLTDSTVIWKRRPDAEERVYRVGELRLDGVNLREPARLRLRGELQGEPLALTGTAPSPAIFLQAGAASPFAVEGSLGGAKLALSGDMSIERGDDRSIDRLVVQRLAVSYDGLDATGTGSLDFGGDGTRLIARLKADELALDRLAGDGGGRGDGAVLDRRLPFDLLPSIDGRVELSAGGVTAGRWRFEQVTATAALERGTLTLDPVKGRVAGGSAWLRAVVDTARSPARVTVAGQGDGLDMGTLYRALLDEGLIEGRGEATADLEARGDTLRALLGSADGTTKLIVRDGLLLNRYWELIAADLAKEFIPGSDQSDRGRLNCLVGRFNLEDGRADARVLMVDTERVLVGGEGTVRLADQRLDLRLVPQPKDPSLISLATPILLKGTIQDPKPLPDPVEVAKGLGAIAAGAVMGPLAALLPFVSGGTVDDACPAAIAVAEGRKPPAPAARTGTAGEQNKAGGIKGLFEGLRKAIE